MNIPMRQIKKGTMIRIVDAYPDFEIEIIKF